MQMFEKEPNGGWAWVVTLAAFSVNGIAWGTAKTLGVFFVDIKDEFAVSNTAVSWLLTVAFSTLTLAGNPDKRTFSACCSTLRRHECDNVQLAQNI